MQRQVKDISVIAVASERYRLTTKLCDHVAYDEACEGRPALRDQWILVELAEVILDWPRRNQSAKRTGANDIG